MPYGRPAFLVVPASLMRERHPAASDFRVARRAAEAARGGNAQLRATLEQDILAFDADLPGLAQVRGYDGMANFLNNKAEPPRALGGGRLRSGDVGMAKWITAKPVTVRAREPPG